jgi:hypothetical protein
MPRYYFHIRDGEEFVKDEEGIELEDIAEAQMEAAATLADVSKEFPLRSPQPLGFSLSIEVRDANGPLFEAAFRFVTRH